MDLLTRSMDDTTRVATYKARVGVTAAEEKVREDLLGPLTPATSQLLDIQA